MFSTDTGHSFDEIQNPFIIQQNFNKLKIKKNIANITLSSKIL